jgi:Plasmid replication region DNA-binding N-term
MSRGVSREEVFAACEKVWKNGKPVTPQNVRAILATGSFTTISKYIKEWKEQSEKELIQADIPIPEEMHGIFKEHDQRLYNRIYLEASLNCADERIDILERENDILRDENERLREEKVKVELLEKQVRELGELRIEDALNNEKAIAKLQEENQALKKDVADLQQQFVKMHENKSLIANK